MPAQGSLLIHGRTEAVLAIAMINCTICNNGNKTLSTRRYSARLIRHKPEIKMTPRIMQGCISGDSLTTFCIKVINLAIQLWFQYQVNYNYPSLDQQLSLPNMWYIFLEHTIVTIVGVVIPCLSEPSHSIIQFVGFINPGPSQIGFPTKARPSRQRCE